MDKGAMGLNQEKERKKKGKKGKGLSGHMYGFIVVVGVIGKMFVI